VECQPIALTYTGGTAPFFLSILPGGEISSPPLEQFPEQSVEGSYTWLVNLPAGTAVTFKLTDSTGAVNYSAQLTVQAGSTADCLPS